MHILVLPSWYPTEDDPIKGSFFQEQAAALARFGHRVTVFAVYNDGRTAVKTEKRVQGNFTEYLLHVKPLRFHLTYFRVLAEMRCLLRETGKPDILHVHSFQAIRYARALKKMLRVPAVVTEHVTWFERNMLSKRELKRISRDYNAMDGVIAVGEGLRRAIQPLCEKEVRLIPNMVDRRFLEQGRHMERGEVFHFVSVGLLDHKKGFDILLRAFAAVHANDPATSLTVCGDGDEMDNLRALVRELELTDSVELAGSCSREECARRLKQSQAFVLPSRHETFGIVFVEAMGCGLPIIMSKTSAWKSLVHPETGLAVEIEDVDGLADAMLSLMEHYEDYDSRTIRRFCMEHYSETAVCTLLTEEYDSLRHESRKEEHR